MITAVDSSVILDVLMADERFVDGSESALRESSQKGQLVICECVVSEIRPALRSEDEFHEFMADWRLSFSASSLESSLLAGELFRQYLIRGGKAGRIVADFLIGAHAQCHADRLLARDRGYLRDYFSDLTVLDPSAGHMA